MKENTSHTDKTYVRCLVFSTAMFVFFIRNAIEDPNILYIGIELLSFIGVIYSVYILKKHNKNK